MRKPAIIALLLCVLVPLSASASNRHRHHTAVQSSREIIVASSTIRTPAPLPPALVTTATPVPTVELAAPVALPVGPTKVVHAPSAVSPVCFNYGHQVLVNDNYDQAQVAMDLAVLKASGVNCLRMAYYDYGNPTVSYNGGFLPEKLARMIQAWGAANNWHFRIIIGGDFATMSSSKLAAYDASVMTTAAWAQAHDVEQLSLGNEEEARLSGLSQEDWDAHVRSLAAQVKTVYSGQVSYEIDPAYLNGWISGGIGQLDVLGINTYCCYSLFSTQAITAFGKDHVYLSEFNDDRSVFSNSESLWAASLGSELTTVQAHGVPIYYFTYRDGGDGVKLNQWALQMSTGQNHLIAQALGIVQAQ